MKSQTRSLTQPETLPTRATVVPLQVTPKKMRSPARLRPFLQRAIPALCGVMLLLLLWQMAALNSKGFPGPYANLASGDGDPVRRSVLSRRA